MNLPFMRSVFSACSPAGEHAPLSILIFHRVLPRPDPLFPDEIDVARFDAILGWLRTWLNVLPLAEAIERLRTGSLPRRAACITFDDGYADNLTHAVPVLNKHGLHSTFFIATGFLDGGRMWNDTLIEGVRGTANATLDLTSLGLGTVATASIADKRRALATIIPALKHREPVERDAAVAAVAEQCATALPSDLMLTSAQLRELRDAGMGIGAHTVTHPILARCTEATARREIADSRAYLEAALGERIGLFAYPNGKLGGDYTPAHAKMVMELGFDGAVSTNPGVTRRSDDPFQIRRFTPWDTQQWRFGLRLARNLLSS